MPRAPKYCTAPDCLALVTPPQRNCPEHGSRWPTDRRTQRTTTAEHRAWADAVLTRAGHRCQLRYAGCTGTAAHADHIQAVAEGGAEYDPGNGQAACRHCHQLKSSDEGHRAQGHHVPERQRQ